MRAQGPSSSATTSSSTVSSRSWKIRCRRSPSGGRAWSAPCQKGLSVAFTTAAALLHQLMEAQDEKRLLKLQRELQAVKLLIVDELGYVPFVRLLHRDGVGWSRQIHCNAFQIGERAVCQRTLMSGAQDHSRCLVCLECFLPAGCT